MKKIELKNPIKRGEKTEITAVEVREPKAGELRGLKLMEVASLDVNAMTELLQRITTPALTKQELNTMNLGDFTALSTSIAEYFEGKPSPEQ